jgi:hypothetical protein
MGIGGGKVTGLPPARLMVRTGERAVRLRRFIILVTAAIGLASCSQEVEYSDRQRACITQRYKDFNAKSLSQCVDVCKACMNGNDITCNTSCKLKGAS